MKKIFLASTGTCFPSRSDFKLITAYIKENGWKLVKKIGAADIIIVNTCAFIKDNEDQSLSLIKKAYKEKSKSAQLFVVGCLPSINKDRLSKIHKGMAVTANSLKELDDLLHARVSIKEILYTGSPIRSNRNKHKQYLLRIGWGCNGKCSYCAVRFVFGKPHSRSLLDIILEYDKAYKMGYRKFVLIANDAGCYGRDLNSSLASLLDKLYDKHKDCKFALSHLIPNRLIDILPGLERFIHSDKIWRVNMPVESGSDRILRLMNRPYTVNDFKYSIQKLIDCNPNLEIKTDILVGFPTETEQDFLDTLRLVEWLGRHKVSFQPLPYSKRPNTEASKMSNQIDQKTKKERLKQVNRLCEISYVLRNKKLFKKLERKKL